MEKIFHIPHSSTYIPEKYINEFLVSKKKLKSDAFVLCDNRTNEMVDNGIIFQYSRLFCDVERFNSDLEEMNDIGMGVLYTVNQNLELIRKEPSLEIIKYYEKHHENLNMITRQLLKENDEILFIDLHSYSKEILPYEKSKKSKRPEICIGINKRHNKIILNKILNIINNYGYTTSINEPFSGCLLPSDYNDDKRVHGIMIEIRKDIYDTKEKFQKIKNMLKCVNEL